VNIDRHTRQNNSLLEQKKVLHIGTLNRASANRGVVQQLEWEQAAADDLDFHWSTELFTTDADSSSGVLRLIPKLMRRFILRRLYTHIRVRRAASNFDTIIIRHAPLDPFGMFYPKSVRKKIWYVFHTNTDFYLRSRIKYIGRISARFDTLLTRLALRSGGRIIGVTEELINVEQSRLKLGGKRSVVYPNGLYLPDWKEDILDKRAGSIKIAFIASRFYDWNGLELIIESMCAKKKIQDCELHLVGELFPHQRKMIEENGLYDQVIEHGVLDKHSIDRLLSRIDLTLGAFALEKVNMVTACTLKVRESLGSGVAVYSGHIDVGFSDSSDFFKTGPADWYSIIEMARKNRGFSKENVRNWARVRIDKNKLLEDLMSELKK